jgi:transaldolase
MNPLLQLHTHGQSYWLDNLTREMLVEGTLRHRVETEDLRGVTSNPAIFHKAISGGEEYDEAIDRLAADGLSVLEIYEQLTVTDVQGACDVLRPVYDTSGGVDGYVSLEVSPHLAHDTDGTLQEARRLFAAVDRPNVLIKIPGTPAGVPAIEEALYDGLNINVTLLFSITAYEAIADAYVRALERRVEEGRSIDDVASVASFFLSRIDTLTDARLEAVSDDGDADGRSELAALKGQAAVANAKLAYQNFKRRIESERWVALARQGARPQRMLWASTSTKDPEYRDVKYVEPLIGPHTVNTMPESTIRAFVDHGTVADTVEEGVEKAHRVMSCLADAGVDFGSVTDELLEQGVEKFVKPFDALLEALAAQSGGVGTAAPVVTAGESGS